MTTRNVMFLGSGIPINLQFATLGRGPPPSNIDGLRKAGDAPGHKIVVAVCVCVFVVVVVVGGGGGGGGMTLFVGQKMVTFPAPQRPDPKISQRTLNPQLAPTRPS